MLGRRAGTGPPYPPSLKIHFSTRGTSPGRAVHHRSTGRSEIPAECCPVAPTMPGTTRRSPRLLMPCRHRRLRKRPHPTTRPTETIPAWQQQQDLGCRQRGPDSERGAHVCNQATIAEKKSIRDSRGPPPPSWCSAFGPVAATALVAAGLGRRSRSGRGHGVAAAALAPGLRSHRLTPV